MWLQGAYFYHALCSASPLFRDLAKNAKPIPYLEAPFTNKASENEQSGERLEIEIENLRTKTYLFFSNWARNFKDK